MQDAAHKLLYGYRHMVADLLRGFLPDGAEAGFDFDTLEPMRTSHVGRRLERREGDTMWRLRAHGAPAGGWVHVLVLLEFQSSVDRSMALRVLTYTGLAWEGLLRSGPGSEKRSGKPSTDRERPREEARSGVEANSGSESRSGGGAGQGDNARPRRRARSKTPLPPVIPFVVYNGSPVWTAPEDVSDLIGPAPPPLARLQPRNRYVLLDMQRADTRGVPEDNLVGLQAALIRIAPGDSRAREILARLRAALAGPEHEGLRKAFARWLRRSWDEDYDVEADADGALRAELDRLESDGEVEAMGSLAAERWKEQQRQREAQIRAQEMERGMERGRTLGREEGRAEGMEFVLERQATHRFNASTGERLSALLAGVSEPERLAAVSDAVIECGTGEELLDAAKRIVGKGNS